jgi:phosphohistidine phosphatase
MKTLYLVRHAKSSWDDPSLDDRERPLNGRGRRNAPVMAQRLAQREVRIDNLVSSPALRALTTAHYLAQGIGFDEESIEIEPQLYFSGVTYMLQRIQAADPVCEHLMLVGHNPDMTSLLNHLCGHQTYNMPTCAIATIEFSGDWSQISARDGTLVDFDYPKKG